MAKTKTNVNCTSAQLLSEPAKFTLTEWHVNNRFRQRCTEAQQELSDLLLARTRRVCEQAMEVIKTNKEETDHQLKAKLDEIEFRKAELLRIRKDALTEIDELLDHKNLIVDVLKAVKENAAAICEKCLAIRSLIAEQWTEARRIGIDLVCDDVEKDLLKERDVIENAQSSLEHILEETCEQIRKMKSALYCINDDLKNKEDNLIIDNRNVALKETDLNLSLHFDISCHDKSITLNEWEMQANNNIINASKDVHSGRPSRLYIEKMIKRIIDGLNKQKDITNEAFKQRIAETQKIKMKLELQHSEIVKQITVMSDSVAEMRQCIIDKENYLALACTRMASRCQRPRMELTQDLVDDNLVKEIQELRNFTANLKQLLSEAEISLRHLLKTQVQLEEDINVKMNTLKIDEVECMTLRHSITYPTY